MKRNSIFAVLLTATFFFQAIAQSVQFRVPLIVGCGDYRDTLWLGVSGDGPGGVIKDNTYAPDGDASYGQWGQWRELLNPPDPPSMTINAKFVNIPGRTEIIGTGIKPCDFRGFSSINQIDTFAICIYGDSVKRNPVTITWPKDLKAYGRAWRLLKDDGDGFVNVMNDMTSAQVYTDSNVRRSKELNYLLIKTGVVPQAKRTQTSE
jgi:hypothetical protein